jgi:Flp pilus assembly pilin Flp
MNAVHKLANFRLKYLYVIARFCIWRDDHGQDLIEYALMAGFVATAAGAIMPAVSSSISKIFSKVSSVMNQAAS